MTSTDSFSAQLLLASSFENIEVAERTLLDLVSLAGCTPDDEYWMVTALREALANAIRHGNCQDVSKKVRVSFIIMDDKLTMRVEDEGEGFEPAEVPDPTDPKNLLRPSGRGIFYMRQFMDQVDFAPAPRGGTAVTMVRKLVLRRSEQHEE